MKSNQLLPGQELYNRVRAGFILQNTTLGEWYHGVSQLDIHPTTHYLKISLIFQVG